KLSFTAFTNGKADQYDVPGNVTTPATRIETAYNQRSDGQQSRIVVLDWIHASDWRRSDSQWTMHLLGLRDNNCSWSVTDNSYATEHYECIE
ncbi:hypothetical protein PMAYCL1PPCAC_16025, partial [Pristionchus mayeri]